MPLSKRHFRWVPTTSYIIFLMLPLIPVAYLSLHSTLERPGISSTQLTLINYTNLLNNTALKSSILNSVTYVLLNILITIPIALPAAYAFSRYKFIADKHIFLAFLALRMTPPVVLVFPVFQLFSTLNLVNTPLAIALAHCLFTVPVTIWVLESFITAIPKEIDETAFIDGYSFPRFFFRRLIPLLMPGISVAAFFCFMFSWVEVVFARILTVTNGKPISMAISTLFSFRTDIGLVMAMTVVSMLPGVLLIYFVRNHISKGFMVGQVR
jgi:glycerol transport system permease protein